LIDSRSAKDMKKRGSRRPASRLAPRGIRPASAPRLAGALPKSDTPPTRRSTNAFRYITQLRSPRRHQELT